MALANIAAALTQWAENCDWIGSTTKAHLALEAINYLLVIRPQGSSFPAGNRSVQYADLSKEKEKLEEFLTATTVSSTSNPKTHWVRGVPI